MILLDPDLDPEPAPQSAARIPSVRTLARFLSAAQSAVHLRGQVTVLLTTDRRIRQLNRDFRGLDKPTDVLSFPLTRLIQNQEKIAGDLAISIPTARRQSAEHGHFLGTELKILILHGLLHLAGYDHASDTGQMARRERRLRAQFHLPLGLIERSSPHPSSRPKRGRTAGVSRREATKIAPDGVRSGTRRTQSGESNPITPKPRRGGRTIATPFFRSAQP